MEPFELRFGEARALLESRELGALELCSSVLDRIEEEDPSVRAFLAVRERADVLRDAVEIDRLLGRREAPGPLAGIPVAVKDNIVCRGLPTTAGSGALEGYVSPYDATAVERLRAAGAIVVGKTNMDEFAMGSSCENSAMGATRNPWNLSRVPGGSSGGSAAAVSCGMATLALGSDTGGSVRQPAGFCGVVGYLPSYGLVSRYGLIAFASSLDQIGAMSRDVAGVEALVAAVGGHDPRDATSAAVSGGEAVTSARSPDPSSLRIGVPAECLTDELDPEVRGLVLDAVGAVRDAGAVVVELSLPALRCAVAAYHVVADAEASTNLARYDGVGFGRRAGGAAGIGEMYRRSRTRGFGIEVKRRIILGTFVLSEGHRGRYYEKAREVRSAIAGELEAVFERVDVLATPTSPGTAFALGERVDDPLAMYLSDVYTVVANLAGLPAVSLPCGLAADGLPVGLQLIGPRMGDAALLSVASIFEKLAGCESAMPRV